MKNDDISASFIVVLLMLSTAKWQNTQGSISPCAFTCRYFLPPAMHPPTTCPSFQKSANSIGFVRLTRQTVSRSVLLCWGVGIRSMFGSLPMGMYEKNQPTEQPFSIIRS